jgi:hypothetical protein
MATELPKVPLDRSGEDHDCAEQEAAQQVLDARQALIAERFGSAQDLTAELLGATTDTEAAAAAGREAGR